MRLFIGGRCGEGAQKDWGRTWNRKHQFLAQLPFECGQRTLAVMHFAAALHKFERASFAHQQDVAHIALNEGRYNTND